MIRIGRRKQTGDYRTEETDRRVLDASALGLGEFRDLDIMVEKTDRIFFTVTFRSCVIIVECSVLRWKP